MIRIWRDFKDFCSEEDGVGVIEIILILVILIMIIVLFRSKIISIVNNALKEIDGGAKTINDSLEKK